MSTASTAVRVKFRKVAPAVWNDRKFRELDDDAKLVWFLLLTHPGMTALGAMRNTLHGLAIEPGWPISRMKKAFTQIESRAMVHFDAAIGVMWLPNFLRYNAPESPNVVRAWRGSIEALPEGKLRDQITQHAREYASCLSHAFGEAFAEAFGEALPKALPNQEQEQEQEPEQEPEYPSPPPPGGDVPHGTKAPSIPDCPHEQIIELYHELMPLNPKVLKWTDARRASLRARWRENAIANDKAGYATVDDGITFWRKFFCWCAESDFLTGQAEPQQSGKRAFYATLDWLIKAENFAKVVEGRYQGSRRNRIDACAGAI